MTTKLIPSYISLTTLVGCPVYCQKYCPQERIIRDYKGEKKMTYQMFRRFTETVDPKTTALYFGGFGEPSANPETIDMMEWANDNGFQICYFSTLVGLKEENVKRLCDIPFALFVLHCPDAEGIAHIPYTEEYGRINYYVQTHVKRLKCMNMGELEFVTNRREDLARGIKFQEPYKSKRGCVFLDYPRYELMPNGEMYYCCETSCLAMPVGSLHKNTYPELAALHPKLAKQYRNDRSSLCYYCCQSEPYWSRRIRTGISSFKERALNGVPLKETKLLKGIWERWFA